MDWEKKGCKDKIPCGMNLNWDSNQFTLLGIEFDTNLSKMPQLNYSKALVKVNEMLNTWKKRQLTALGKITVIKTLVMSKLNHLFISIPLPSDDFCKELSKTLYKFVLDDKPKKIKREIIQQKKNRWWTKNAKYY